MNNLINPADKEAYLVPMEEEILQAGYAAVYEIPLSDAWPCPGLFTFPEWCLRFKENPEAEWMRRTTPEQAEADATKSFVEECRRFVPESIVVAGERAWCKVGYLLDDSLSEWFLLGERGASSCEASWLTSAGFEVTDEIVALFSFFNGFREDYSPSGGYVYPLERENVINRDFVQEHFAFDLDAMWDPSICFFGSRCGDPLLINRRGQCGWWEAEATHISKFSNSIRECIDRWIESRKADRGQYVTRGPQSLRPFDPYRKYE